VAAIRLLTLGFSTASVLLMGSISAHAQADSNQQKIATMRQGIAALPAPTIAKPVKHDESHQTGIAYLKADFLPVTGGIAIHYDWQMPTSVAAFIRNNMLWVVFDHVTMVKHAELDPKIKLRLQNPAQVVNAQATILTYQLMPGQWVGVEQSGNSWTVNIKDTEILPRTLLSTQTTANSIAGGAVTIPVKAASQIIPVSDPQAGDIILVAPVASMAQGFVKSARLRGGELLATGQGIAFVPLSSRYAMVRQDDAVLITDSAASSMSGPASTFVRSAVGQTTARLIDMESWSLKDGRRFDDIETDLLYDLSISSKDDQQKKRWKIASFYLARGLPQRSLGVMEAMARKDQQVEKLPQFLAVRGVAALLARDYAAAREDLLNISLDGVAEIWLWRAKLHDAEQRPQAAVEAFRQGSDVMAYYAPAVRADFQLAAIRSAIAISDGAMAQQELSILPRTEMLPEQKNEALYWQARLAALQGHLPEALKIYQSFDRLIDRRSFAMAQLSATKIRVDNGSLALSPAIAGLERLRYAWRGDALEIDLLDTLADYYNRSRRYREALLAYRQTISYFTANDHTRDALMKQDKLFRTLFIDGAADSLAPIQSLALFTDFRSLAPLGTDGDLMIRRLSERLVDVSLYNRAAELLEHQVRYRLEGIAQAVVASRLAMVQILAEKPQAALDVIRFTRRIVVDGDVQASRNRIEARALIDLADFEAADVLLDGDTSATGYILNADLAWKRKDWRQLVNFTTKILANDHDDFAMHLADRRKHILRLAFAQNMLNNILALQSLRILYKPAMAGGDYEQAFDLLASGASLSPTNIRSLSKTLVSIDQLDSFRDMYRAELRSMDIPLTTTASITAEQASALTPAAGKPRRPLLKR
jgi:hypothetical protein